MPSSFSFDEFTKNTSIGTSTIIVKKKLVENINFSNTRICEDYFYKCSILKKIKVAYCFNDYLTTYIIRKQSLQSNNLRNLYWMWKINKKYNKFNIYQNLTSLLCISINSILKYGFK